MTHTRRLQRAALPLLALVALLAAACGGGEDEPTAGSFPVALTDARVSAGTELYAENCAACHGTPGVSRPPIATTPPHDETGHTWHHPDRLLFQWVLDRPPLAITMPAFRGVLSEDEVLSILAFIKSTWPKQVQEMQRDGSIQYEQQVRENP